MAERLTEQQQAAVENRGGKLLVSAAAGSGKTKVLVDRILGYLTDPVSPADLDDFLIITYTKAAAAELRGKIAAKLTQRIAEQPENRHLQRQMQRLYLTKISTVHAFCSDILREYSYKLDLSADFRVADETDCLRLQERAMNAVLDSSYENAAEDSDFCAFIDSQGFGRDDRQIPDIILGIYQKAVCHLNPKAWLDWCVKSTDTSSIIDASETVWGRYLMDDLFKTLDLYIDALQSCIKAASELPYMEKPVALFHENVDQLILLRNSKSWDDIVHNADISFGTLTFSKKCDHTDLIEKMKAVRGACKEALKKKLVRFNNLSAQILTDIAGLAPSVRGLVSLVKKFMDAYKKQKQGKRVLDFSDLEHYTLDLLLGVTRTGRTAISKELSSRFLEVLVDEYQDSNAVQDAIFNAITEDKQNLFMVGDVKQSIYQFRLADPGIFLDKYERYEPAEVAEVGRGRKLVLSKNFRSGIGVIDAVNHVFSCCMSQSVGGLNYTEKEALYEGIAHIELDEPEIELHTIRVDKDTYAEEADFVADHICEMLNGKHMVRDQDKLRPVKPEDIVILLRSPGSVGGDFRYALESRGVRCVSGNTTDLLETEEIQVLRSLLQTVSNPLQDIPLIGLMSSRIFCFSADELAGIRAGKTDVPFYYAVTSDVMQKSIDFVRTLSDLRFQAGMSTVTELIDYIFAKTHLDSVFSALEDGDQRKENLQHFYRLAAEFERNSSGDLEQFLDYLSAMESRGLVVSDEQNVTGAVSIMSIHKSKGLEFPVVYLCGLSKTFNMEDARKQVLCHKELGLGMSCIDRKNRVRYPSVIRNAIAVRMMEDSVSEELRVLYVAMTRAKDRLVMTYASHNLDKEIMEISSKMDFADPILMTSDVSSAGEWVLYASLFRSEAAPLWELGVCPHRVVSADKPWLIRVEDGKTGGFVGMQQTASADDVQIDAPVFAMKRGLAFRYPYKEATITPSKQTATQLKGRYKDHEASENAGKQPLFHHEFRKPAFIENHINGRLYGTALHAVMQYIRYEACEDIHTVGNELQRLVADQYISSEQSKSIRCEDIVTLFNTDIGKRLRESKNVIREFKFSILDDAGNYAANVEGDQVLLQGVVDCALIEEDGITIIDYKTDKVTESTVSSVAESYRLQVQTYAYAMSRIYDLPVKEALLYFFKLGRFVRIL